MPCSPIPSGFTGKIPTLAAWSTTRSTWRSSNARAPNGCAISATTRNCCAAFRRPARLDDALRVSVALTACRGASLVLAQSIERDGECLLEAEVRCASLRAADFRPRPMPEAMHARLKALETRVPSSPTE